jgi:hypothetical protein
VTKNEALGKMLGDKNEALEQLLGGKKDALVTKN